MNTFSGEDTDEFEQLLPESAAGDVEEAGIGAMTAADAEEGAAALSEQGPEAAAVGAGVGALIGLGTSLFGKRHHHRKKHQQPVATITTPLPSVPQGLVNQRPAPVDPYAGGGGGDFPFE